jgi:hypothetical protein
MVESLSRASEQQEGTAMVSVASQHRSIYRTTRAQQIRETFARSPLFRGVVISESLLSLEGEMALDISFDGSPTVFRVVAGTKDGAYAILHELANTMVDVEESLRPNTRVVEPEWGDRASMDYLSAQQLGEAAALGVGSAGRERR